MNLTQLQKNTSLSQELANSLKQKILDGKLKVGEKLPPSKVIEQQVGVSRSVVREAIAQLKAEGLVDSRQGVGVFVARSQVSNAFNIAPSEFEDIQNAIQILQLRSAIEVEMSGMAAEFRSQEQLEEIERYMNSMDSKIAEGLGATDDDMKFHRAIAKASGNPYFDRFIEFIGSAMIPAREIITAHESNKKDKEFLQKIRNEHHKIYEAIAQQDVKRAKQAAKTHLSNSIRRHEKLVEQYNQQTASIFTKIVR